MSTLLGACQPCQVYMMNNDRVYKLNNFPLDMDLLCLTK